MTKTGKTLFKLAILIVPGLTLFSTLYLGSKGDGAGGGSYDLSELVYSGLFTFFVICWNVWGLVSLTTAKTPADQRNDRILLLVGITTLIGSTVWFIRHLS